MANIRRRTAKDLQGTARPNSCSPFSEEMRRQISERMKGKRNVLGARRSEEFCRKQSEARRGERGSNWQGGKSFEPYLPTFNKVIKRTILERDNHKCQICGEVEMLLVHHIDSNKQNSGIENLVTWCFSCHSRYHQNLQVRGTARGK